MLLTKKITAQKQETRLLIPETEITAPSTIAPDTTAVVFELREKDYLSSSPKRDKEEKMAVEDEDKK